MHIALLEDDKETADLMALWLESAGHDVVHYVDGESFNRAILKERFDLLILDWLLPDTTGDQVLRWIRETMGWEVPIVFITKKDSQEDIVAALNLGADDYMTKPVSAPVLQARISAVGRRYHKEDTQQSNIIERSPYRFDTAAHEVVKNGELLPLTPKEFDLASFIFKNDGRLLTRGHIQEAVWGHKGVASRTVDIHISRIRKKLGIDDTPWRLSAIYHHGYRLERSADDV